MLKVEQALFGEAEGGGHGLRTSSLDKHLVRSLAGHLDLPQNLPLGVSMDPYLSGFPHSDWYVIARTFLDPSASRGQLVVSHALICSRDELSGVANIRPLIAALIKRPDESFSPVSLSIALDPALPDSTPDMQALAVALVQTRSLPVVRLDNDGFDDLVVAIWARMPRSLRQNFNFRASFGPNDIHAPAPALVYSPRKLRQVWDQAVVIEPSSQVSEMPLAARLLCGDSAAQPLLEFASEIGAPLTTFSDLGWLDRTSKWISEERTSFDRLLNAVRGLSMLSPDPSTGVEAKTRVIARLAAGVAGAPLTDILKLRNLEGKGIPHPDALWKALELWIANHGLAEGEDEAFLGLLANVNDARKAVPAWSQAVLAGLQRSVCDEQSAVYSAFWRWATYEPTAFERAANLFPADATTQERLTAAAPSHLAGDVAHRVMTFAKGRHWLALHGAAVATIATAEAAVRAQMAADPALSDADGVRASLRTTQERELVDCAMALQLPAVTAAAARIAADNPGLLSARLVDDVTGREIWRQALAIKPDVWRGSQDPQATMGSLLDGLLDRSVDPDGLVESLSHTALADLCFYGRREQVWGGLAAPLADRFKRATAEGWLRLVSQTRQSPFIPDPVLQRAILALPALDAALKSACANIEEFVAIVATLPGVDERRIGGFMQNLLAPRPWSSAAAQALGRLLLDRGWRDTARNLASMAYQRSDVLPALRVSASLIDTWTRWKLGISSLSTDEKWDLFEETVATLYPGGPDDGDVWERAGGKNADLRTGGTGRDRWRDALRKVRYGTGVSEKKILSTIAKDFSHNDKIEFLRKEGLSASSWW